MAERSSSLSSVVSNLIRASMGSSASNTVKDEDLDREIAEIILKEAKKKAEKYKETGVKALYRVQLDSNAPRTNKRFLSSIIKSTDDHNKTLLRAQALAAEEVKRERLEQEKRERRRRAEEAVEAERSRRRGRSGLSFSSSSSSRRERRREERSRRKEKEKRVDYEDEEVVGWDHWDGRNRDKDDERKREKRDWETWGVDDDSEDGGRDSRRRSYRSRSKDKDRRRDKEDRHSRRKRNRSVSYSPDERRSSKKHKPRRSPSRSRSPLSPTEQTDEEYRRHRRRSRTPDLAGKKGKAKKYALDDGFDDDEGDSRGRSPSISSQRSPTPGPLPVEDREVDLRKKLLSSRESGVHDSQPPPPRETERSHKRKSSPELPHRSQNNERSRSPPTRRSPSPPHKRTKVASGSASSKTLHTRSPSNMSLPSRPSRSPSPGPSASLQLPSKMDRYFEESYDPRLDIATLSVPQVPKTGLISDAEFEGWEAMLELIRLRREDKLEKKRMERLGIPKEKPKVKMVTTTTTTPVVAGTSADRWNSQSVSVMDIRYKKRGTVREWDLGKEGF